MKTTKIYCPDIECDSCVKVIDKTLKNVNGVQNVKVNKDSIEVSYNENTINSDKISKLITEKGYRTSLEPFTRKNFLERWRDFRENKHKYQVEYKMFVYSFYILLILWVLQGLIYFTPLKDFLIKYFPWFIYVDISIISLGAAIWHFKSYKSKNISGMTGMMIGMTFGMQSGMMIGTIIGATNGMFTGTMIGMLFGVILGFYTGKCCGIMGALQGMMAGLMGGTMGGMIGVMMYADHIQIFMPFFILINLLIMWGLSYYLYEEIVEENQNTEKKQINFWKFAVYSLIFTIVLVLIIFYGPKSGLSGV